MAIQGGRLMMIVRKKDKNEEMGRMLIESGAINGDDFTKADIVVDFTPMNRPPVYNLGPLLRRMSKVKDDFCNETGLDVRNVRIDGTLYNRNVGNSFVATTVFLDKFPAEKGFFRPRVLKMTVVYTHSGPVDVRDTVQTGMIADSLRKLLSQNTHGVEVKVNGKLLDEENLSLISLTGGFQNERIRELYMAINSGFNEVTTTEYQRLYHRRHSCTQTLGVHARRMLYAMGIFTGDADRWFWTKDPDKEDNPAEVEFYSLPRHTIKTSDINWMYGIMSEYVYPDPDTKYTLDVKGRLLLDASPESMIVWLKN